MAKHFAIGTRVVCLVVNESITGLEESEALIIGYEKDELSKYLGEFAVVELPNGKRCNIHPSHVISDVDTRKVKP